MIAWMLAALVAATPLVDAVRQQDVAAVRALLKSGADVNRQEGDGATALHWAANADSTELVRLLLDAGASPAAANDLGVTPLHLAAANGNVAIVYGAGMSEGNGHVPENLPILVVGGAGGRIASARHVKFVKGTPLANFHLGLLDRFGVRIDQHGNSTGAIDLA